MVCFNFQAPTQKEIAAQRRKETIRAKHNGHTHLTDAFDRRIQNRPWTREELHGTQSAYATYAAGNDIRGRPCRTETIRA